MIETVRVELSPADTDNVTSQVEFTREQPSLG
jgi:hypothetical protein